ncbi:hypothetical protein DPMN_079555 [Dreissena polymorpha]|uniref:Uncharacterized protein n=1 Tax=Dreissena polymorpha TaxID=45954 RepID=A0A9D3YTD5_DREPO|nr:hypothetical protein DPMN_079555 [Dreissena polymorpha]
MDAIISRVKRGYVWPEIKSEETKERLEKNEWTTFLIVLGVVALVILLTFIIYKIWRWSQTACANRNVRFQKLPPIDSMQVVHV